MSFLFHEMIDLKENLSCLLCRRMPLLFSVHIRVKWEAFSQVIAGFLELLIFILTFVVLSNVMNSLTSFKLTKRFQS